MIPQNLEDLLKAKIVVLDPDAQLDLAVLDQAQILKKEKPGRTIARIESSNGDWVGRSVTTLPDPGSGEISKSLRIWPVVGLMQYELLIKYYDTGEV